MANGLDHERMKEVKGGGTSCSAVLTSAAWEAGRAPTAFVALTAAPGERRGCEIKTCAYQAFRLLRRTGFGNSDVPPAEAVRVESAQGCSRQFGAGHGDKGVPSRLVRGRIEHQLNLRDAPYPREQEPQVGFGDARREVADI